MAVDLLDAPLVHDRDAVRQRQRLGLIVGHVDEGDADFLLQIDELDLHFLAQLGVERRERLVEEQHRWMRDQRATESDALLLAAGKFVRIAFPETNETHVLERSLHLGGDLGRGCPGHLQRKRDVAFDVMCGNKA